MSGVRATRDTAGMAVDAVRPAAAHTKLTDLVIVSGMSGAGKSSAMNVFEDAGYFCVDNLPAEMIRALADLFRHEGSKVERACVVADARGGGEYLESLARVIDDFRTDGLAHRTLFLTADQETLLTRYKETRRRHPLSPTGSILDGILTEQSLLAPIRERADAVIDTTGLSASMLRRKVADELLEPEAPGKLAVTFVSFGHKHGPPRDADLALDVRFLPNPHYEPELRALTGFDRRIIEYVGRDGRLKEFYDRALPLLEYLLPQYVSEGKAHLVVAIGCTGGRHRSVVIAEDLGAHFREQDSYFVEVQHRDVERAPARGEAPPVAPPERPGWVGGGCVTPPQLS
jgi:RNase adapter protein RapZ